MSFLPIPSQDAIAVAQTYGLWIQTGAICLSAIAALFLVLYSKNIACRRATLDLIMAEETDPSHRETRLAFIKLRQKGELVKWAMAEHVGSPETSHIRQVLNRYELVAIGIKNKTVDENLYKAWCRSTLVKDWTACKSFVTELRSTTHIMTVFCECENLARKWATKEELTHI